MRMWTAAAALLLALSTGAQAQEWCGFQAKPNAVVRCGFSSYQECHDVLGKKNVDCIPDPEFASRTPSPRSSHVPHMAVAALRR